MKEIVYSETRSGMMETDKEKRDRQERTDRRLNIAGLFLLPGMVMIIAALSYLR